MDIIYIYKPTNLFLFALFFHLVIIFLVAPLTYICTRIQHTIYTILHGLGLLYLHRLYPQQATLYISNTSYYINIILYKIADLLFFTDVSLVSDKCVSISLILHFRATYSVALKNYAITTMKKCKMTL